MNNHQAFTILLAQIEAALQESLACHNAAARQGNFDAVEVEIERQRNLVSARNQLQSLQELWTGLVGEQRKPETKPLPTAKLPARTSRVPKGSATPRKAYRLLSWQCWKRWGAVAVWPMYLTE
jgi:hypothetical protein